MLSNREARFFDVVPAHLHRIASALETLVELLTPPTEPEPPPPPAPTATTTA